MLLLQEKGDKDLGADEEKNKIMSFGVQKAELFGETCP